MEDFFGAVQSRFARVSNRLLRSRLERIGRQVAMLGSHKIRRQLQHGDRW